MFLPVRFYYTAVVITALLALGQWWSPSFYLGAALLALFALLLLVFMITGATVGELPFVKDLVPGFKFDMFFFVCLTTVIMAWTRIFNPRKASKYVSWDVLVTIACAFAISKGMQNSGFADCIADGIIACADAIGRTEHGPYAMLAILFLITNIFTELITNNAALSKEFTKNGAKFSSKAEFYEAFTGGDYKAVLKGTK